jgi:hypothetical protein
MLRVAFLVGISLGIFLGTFLLTADRSFAQSGPDPAQCEQIKQAVAQYGYAAARQHALENYGPEAVRTGDQCLTEREKGIPQERHASRHHRHRRVAAHHQ